MNAADVVENLLDREPPPRFVPNAGGEDAEMDNAAKQPFTAMEYAAAKGRHHDKLWNKVRGTPFEQQYRHRFKIRD